MDNILETKTLRVLYSEKTNKFFVKKLDENKKVSVSLTLTENDFNELKKLFENITSCADTTDTKTCCVKSTA